MSYAVIQIQGKQYKVQAGDILQVDRLDSKLETQIVLDQVLMFVDGDTVEIGTPNLNSRKVTAKVVEHPRGPKIRVATYKAKSRYRRVIGHRQNLTSLQILSLNPTSKSTPKKTSTSSATSSKKPAKAVSKPAPKTKTVRSKKSASAK